MTEEPPGLQGPFGEGRKGLRTEAGNSSMANEFKYAVPKVTWPDALRTKHIRPQYGKRNRFYRVSAGARRGKGLPPHLNDRGLTGDPVCATACRRGLLG